MTDQPAAPFDEAAYARGLANHVLDRPNADPDDDLSVLARQFQRTIERAKKAEARVKELQHVEGERDAALELADVGSRSAEAAEARVKELEKELHHERTDNGIAHGRWEEQHAHQHAVNTEQAKRLTKAEAANAALVEAATTFLDDFLSKKTCAPGALQRVLASPAPGAKLLADAERWRMQLAEEKLIASTLHQRACDLQEERDRLTARNDTLTKALREIAHSIKFSEDTAIKRSYKMLQETAADALDEETKP